ncbi:phosphorylase family protein [Burkholderia sp. 3C]
MSVLHLKAYRDILDRAFVVVLTTNSHERKAVLDVMQASRKLVTQHDSHRAYLCVADDRVVLVLDGDGAFSGSGAASRFLSDFIANERYPTPAAVVLCGVCWGNPQRVSIGRVLVSGTLISVNRSVAEQSGVTAVIPKTFETTLPDEAVQGFTGVDSIAPATMLSEEQLYKGTQAREELLAQFPAAHGGEMEGFAVVPSCHNKSIPWLVIKAVSDYGDDEFDREAQDDAAKKAAQVFLRGLPAIPLNDERKEAVQSFADVIRGHSFELRKDLLGNEGKLAVEVNHALRGLDSVIDFYTGSESISPYLAQKLCVVIKELALNAIEHGRANRVRVNVLPSGVVFHDDGKPYLLENLSDEIDGRGGMIALRAFQRDHVKQGKVTIKSKAHAKWANGIQFDIDNPHPTLAGTKEKCRAEVDQRECPAIYVHPECRDVYVDIRRVEMMTLALDTVDEFKPLLDAGKKLYVALTDPDIRKEIEKAFKENISAGKLVILMEDDSDDLDPFVSVLSNSQA